MKFLNKVIYRKQYNELRDRFLELAIEVIGIKNLEFEYAERIYKEVEFLLKQHAEVHKGFLSRIYFCDFIKFSKNRIISKQSKDSIAITRFCEANKKLSIEIYLNINKINFTIMKRREVQLKLNNGYGLESSICHEFGHVLELLILYKRNNLEKTYPNPYRLNEDIVMIESECGIFEGIETDLIRICENALNQFGIPNEFKFRPISTACEPLSDYTGKNYQECFAEAITQYYCSSSPSILSKLIFKNYQEFINSI